MQFRAIQIFEEYAAPIVCLVLTVWRKIQFERLNNTDVPPRSILFIKLIEQGALVLHRNCFLEASHKYGKENVFICSFSDSEPIISALDLFDKENVLQLRSSSALLLVYDIFRLIRLIKKRKIDAVLDLEFFSRSSAILTYLTGARYRVGYHRFNGAQNYRGNLFTHRLNYSHHLHVSETGRSMLYALETNPEALPALMVPPQSDYDYRPFEPTPEDEKELSAVFDYTRIDPSKIVLINPSFNDVLPLRKWPEVNYAEVVREIYTIKRDSVFVFTGRADEFEYTEKFIQQHNLKAINLAGKLSLRGLLTLYTKSNLLITSDSGPGHFASLTNIKVIVLFGPETPVLYGPLNKNASILYAQTHCSPCINVYNNRVSTCRDNVCMGLITPQTVKQTIDKL